MRKIGSQHQTIINVDYTHVGRRVSGIERITLEQFNKLALSPLEVRPYKASNQRLAIIIAQMIGLPLHAITNPSEIYVFPGFPPSPFFVFLRDRSILFVHDLFNLTRRAELNLTAKYYMSPMSYLAIKKFRYFLTNSENTAEKLRAYCDPTATIVPYRPHIRNVFGLGVENRVERPNDSAKLRIVSIGTIEPRKNFTAAVKICNALSRRLGGEVELHIIGRFGWGKDINLLRNQPNVILHGYLDDASARPIIESSDLMLCTSLEEGLCLPVIEVQYSGMPVVAPDEGVFREVLGESAILINSRSPESAADQIAGTITSACWRSHYAIASAANVTRWNRVAEKDRNAVISLLSELASQPSRVRGFANDKAKKC